MNRDTAVKFFKSDGDRDGDGEAEINNKKATFLVRYMTLCLVIVSGLVESLIIITEHQAEGEEGKE